MKLKLCKLNFIYIKKLKNPFDEMACQSRIRFKAWYGRRNINSVSGSNIPIIGDKGKLFLEKKRKTWEADFNILM